MGKKKTRLHRFADHPRLDGSESIPAVQREPVIKTQFKRVIPPRHSIDVHLKGDIHQIIVNNSSWFHNVKLEVAIDDAGTIYLTPKGGYHRGVF